MKHMLITAGLLAFLVGLSACSAPDQGTRTDNPDQRSAAGTDSLTGDEQVVYACPMHPEVTGEIGDTCPKCGMDLEAVK